MKFSDTFSAFVAVIFAVSQPALATVAFNVVPVGVSCGSGATITCNSPSAGSPCKGNFSPKQASILVTQAQSGCHISLYPQNNQQGGVVARVSADQLATACVPRPMPTAATWQSYGVYCD
ncbi:hypothetical protein V5O48_014540 [Marasmius crinis-equi]|uniref:Secreted protein n=1 Tax=Marasmius crinis-equi TaxID=585013 RepID=A0ABR3EX23_9AGAR